MATGYVHTGTCAYLKDREWALRMRLAPRDDAVYRRLLESRHRRSGNVVYQPVCKGCTACQPIRVPVDRFQPSKSQRRCLRRNADVLLTTGPTTPTQEKLELHNRFVRARFKVDHDAVILAGYSMGGFGTWNLGLRYHDRFAAIAPMAGGISREEFALGSDELSRSLLGNLRGMPVWFLHGDQDEVVAVKFDQKTAKELKQAQIPFTYHEVKDGKHVLRDFLAGNALTDELREWMATQRRDAHPRRVEHNAIGAYHGGAYWVRLDEVDERARILAVAKKSKVQVLVEGVRRFTLFLDPEVVDAKRSITVLVNGHKVARTKVKPSLEAVAESLARAGDPTLTYARALTIEVPDDLPPVPDEAWVAARK